MSFEVLRHVHGPDVRVPSSCVRAFSALRWRNIFLIPVVLFPVAATVVHTVIVVKFSSVKPTDDLHCDSSDPEW